MAAHPTRPPIEVRLARDDDGASAAIRAAAVGLGIDVETRVVGGESHRIGSVELPADPEPWRIEAALLRALAPRHVLFLCVANSARSQIAEGIARSLASPQVRVSSAGSEPSSLRPQAIAVLDEIGIDISHQRSKGVDEIEGPVDAVVTLCAEEVCPVWLGDAWRLHWGLPDPATVEGSEEERLAAFRRVRDELTERLAVLVGTR